MAIQLIGATMCCLRRTSWASTFTPSRLTDLLEPLDRSVFGSVKAEYRAVYRMDIPRRGDKRMSKAHFAAYLIREWELVSHQCDPPPPGVL
jgi:hypothetical protein